MVKKVKKVTKALSCIMYYIEYLIYVLFLMIDIKHNYNTTGSEQIHWNYELFYLKSFMVIIIMKTCTANQYVYAINVLFIFSKSFHMTVKIH